MVNISYNSFAESLEIPADSLCPSGFFSMGLRMMRRASNNKTGHFSNRFSMVFGKVSETQQKTRILRVSS